MQTLDRFENSSFKKESISDIFAMYKQELEDYPDSYYEGKELIKNINKTFKKARSPYYIDDYTNELMMRKEEEIIFLSNTIPVPIQQEVLHELDQSTSFQITFNAIRKGVTLDTVTVSLNKLSQTKWIKQQWGINSRINLNIQAQQHLCDAINILCENIESVHKYKSIGWIDNEWHYLHGGGVIGDGSLENVIVDETAQELTLLTSNISEKKACKFVLETMLNLADQKMSWTAVSFTFLTLLTTKLRERGQKPEFVYLLVGESGSRKTSFSKVAFNFHEKYLDNVPINLDLCTLPALEQTATQFKDCVCLFDDIPPANTKHEHSEQQRKLERLIRMYGDSIGRQKIQNASKIELKPSGLGVVTAESLITQSASSLARVLYIKANKKSVDLEKLTKAQKKRHHFPTAISYYLGYIAEFGDRYIDRFLKKFQETRELLIQETSHSVHGRLIDMAAWLHTSFINYIEYALYVTDKYEDVERYENLNFSMLLEMINQQQSLITQDNDVNLFVSILKELMVTNKVKLAEIRLNEKKKIVDVTDQTNIIGFADDQYLYFFKDTCFEKVKQHYEKNEKLFPTTLKTLLEKLVEKNLLVPDTNKDKTKTIKLSINKKRVRLIRINRELFEKWDENQ